MIADFVVIDTSVWVEYFRGHRPALYAHVDALVVARQLANLRIITAELLRGANTPLARRAIHETVALIPTVPLSDEFWLDVGEFCHQLSRHGVKASLTDGWIAKAVIDHRCALWSLDKDFQHIARIRHMRLYEPVLI